MQAASGEITRELVIRYSDPGTRLAAVRLVADLYKRRPNPEFSRVNGVWELHLPLPAADRVEYLLELERRNGARELIPDPRARAVPGPFGPKSELLLPRYTSPAWTAEQAPAGEVEPFALPCPTLHTQVEGLLWSPAGTKPERPLPLLLAHDGPEYAAYSDLVHLLDVATASGQLPPLRAALLAPPERDEHYSASARYAVALGRDILPALRELAPSTPGSRPAGLGASLGALALLHAHRRYPELFAALFLQSGSFFRRPHDAHESGFPRFGRIVRFVTSVRTTETWLQPVPVVLTCGTAEENLGSNRALARALHDQGYEVALVETRDAHNWVSWRDALHPHLAALLRRTFA